MPYDKRKENSDLTQMTFGFSRDDAGKFLGSYYENKIYENDPFARLDQEGVGQLVKLASPCIRQGKDSPKDKNKTLRRETQGLIFLCRRLSVIADFVFGD